MVWYVQLVPLVPMLMSQFSLMKTGAAQAQGSQPFQSPSCFTSRGTDVEIPSRNGLLCMRLSLCLCD